MDQLDTSIEPSDTGQLDQNIKDRDRSVRFRLQALFIVFRIFHIVDRLSNGMISETIVEVFLAKDRGRLSVFVAVVRVSFRAALAGSLFPFFLFYILFRKTTSNWTSTHEIAMERLLLLALKPDDAIERLGDLTEDRASVALRVGSRFATFHFWWRGVWVTLGAAFDRVEPYAARVTSLFKLFPKG